LEVFHPRKLLYVRAPLCGALVSCFLLILTSPAFGQRRPTKDSVASNSIPYQIEQLPLRPNAVSNSGWIAGSTKDQQAATWQRKSGLHRVSLPPELAFSEATSINSRGEAVGTASDATSGRRVAFVKRRNKVTLLPGRQARATGISEAGQITGQAIVPGTTVVGPVLWKDSNIVDLRICCAGLGRAINAQGLIAGDTYDDRGRYHAFVWDTTHGGRIIPVPGADFTSSLAVNDRGDVLLKASPDGWFLYTDGNLQILEIPKSTPRSMNNNGGIVGSFGPGPEEQRAFIWDKTNGLRDLNTLIPANSGWKLEVAISVNDQGEIVGWGDHGAEDNVGFLLRLRKPAVKNLQTQVRPR
jgi:hypothetical protein